MEYFPFGTYREAIDYKVTFPDVYYTFTGQEEDDELGFYNFKARLYDPVLGRFITPDTIIPDYSDPQSLNRYAYALNNPLRYTDPTGHQSDETGPGTSTGWGTSNCGGPSGITDFLDEWAGYLNQQKEKTIAYNDLKNNIRLTQVFEDPLNPNTGMKFGLFTGWKPYNYDPEKEEEISIRKQEERAQRKAVADIVKEAIADELIGAFFNFELTTINLQNILNHFTSPTPADASPTQGGKQK